MASHRSSANAGGHSPAELGFGRLFDQMTDGIVVATDDGRIALWNPAATRLFGYTAEEAKGMNVDQLVPEQLRDAHHAGIARFATTGHGKFIDNDTPLELPARHKDGHIFYVDLSLSRLETPEARFVLAIVRDVDERVRMRDETTRHQREVEAANDSLEAFSYVVGHDLKEPVRAMGAYFEEIHNTPPGAEREDLIQRASDAHASMDRLLQGLLEWSRMSMTPIEPEVLHVHQVLAEAGSAAQFEGLVRERGAKIQIDTDIPPVLATEALLTRVFGNLVTNAVRHNPHDAPSVRIRAGAGAPRGMVEILVEDDGPGFPKNVKDRVRKFRHRPATLKGGFGLSITHRAIERLGGTLTLDDRPEGGGVARVHLPTPGAPGQHGSLEDRARELI